MGIPKDYEQPSEPLPGESLSSATESSSSKSSSNDNDAADGFFTFRKFKHLPNLKVLKSTSLDSMTSATTHNSSIKSYSSKDYLTKEEIHRLGQDELLTDFDSFNCTNMILMIVFLILFGFIAIGIGYTIGQN